MVDPQEPRRIPERELPDDRLSGSDAHPPHECLEWCPICRAADVLRGSAPPELRDQWQAVQREALMTTRALIDTYREFAPRIVRNVAGETCPKCGTENPERARFCMSCGAALAATCPSCGTQNPPGAKFCIDCGTALGAGAGATSTAAALSPSPPPTEAPTGEGGGLFGGQLPGAGAGWGPAASLPEERRKATVLFADLSGYTAVAERLDPEAVKSFVDRALRRLGQEVVRYGGSVDKYIGDNVMAVFGAPVAHEDDPERAVRAGLAMQAAMDEINKDIEAATGVRFSLRVGINSGEVLAGQVGDGYTVIGDVVNVASRLQSAARPGSVTVGETTHRLTRGPGIPQRGAAHRARGRIVASSVALRSRGSRGPSSSRHRHRPGGSRQDPLAARVRDAARGARADGGVPRRALPRIRRRARVLGARRDHSRSVRDRRHRRFPTRVGQAAARDRGGQHEARNGRAARAPGGDDRPPARDRAAGRPGDRDRAPRRRGSAADARPPVLGGSIAGRGGKQALASRDCDRGHPLGRRGNARPDRLHGALDPRAGAHRLPGARRAPGATAGLGRRAPQLHDHRPRAALAGRDPRARHRPPPRREWQLRERAWRPDSAGGRAIRGQSPLRRGDGEPDPRGGIKGRPDASRVRPRGPRRAPRLAVGAW